MGYTHTYIYRERDITYDYYTNVLNEGLFLCKAMSTTTVRMDVDDDVDRIGGKIRATRDKTTRAKSWIMDWWLHSNAGAAVHLLKCHVIDVA